MDFGHSTLTNFHFFDISDEIIVIYCLIIYTIMKLILQRWTSVSMAPKSPTSAYTSTVPPKRHGAVKSVLKSTIPMSAMAMSLELMR